MCRAPIPFPDIRKRRCHSFLVSGWPLIAALIGRGTVLGWYRIDGGAGELKSDSLDGTPVVLQSCGIEQRIDVIVDRSSVNDLARGEWA